MKKILLFSIMAIMSVMVSAQIKVESPHPDLNIQVRRAVESSGTVVVDMVITNFGKEEPIKFCLGNLTESVAYDDEGNEYKSMLMGNPNRQLGLFQEITFPQDVPIKVRLQIDEVDAYATKFSIIKIVAESYKAMNLSKKKPIVIRNLEFVKN